MGKITQTNKIFDYMKTGKSINPMTAEDLFACRRLAARIADIKDAHPGIVINKRMMEGTNRFGEKCHYAEYRIVEV